MNTSTTKKIHLLIYVFFITYCTLVNAQTNPSAQSLPYSQNFTALVATSTTYPVGWQGWNLATTGSSAAFRTIAPPASSDLALTASSTAATNSGGIHNFNGKIGILGSGTVDPALCLAIITTGVSNVQVNFDVMTIRNPTDVSNTRINQVDLQYRVGTTGAFTSVSALVNGIYQNNNVNQITAVTTPQNSLAKTFTLPAACNNQAIVQLRWVQRDASGAGGRPSFAVDNISICSATVTPTISISGPSAFCSGGSAKYIATITNGGTTPTYSWKKNGTTVGANSSVLSITGLVATDQISCNLTSNATCVTATTVSSNVITIGTVISSPTISNAAITNVSCPGARNGAINITVSGGTGPYTFAWDTVNTTNGPTYAVSVATKVAGNPLFGQGNPVGYVIDGVPAKELFLIRGITYSFSVLTPGHPFHISTDPTGGNSNFIIADGQSGAPTANGTVTYTPSASTPSLIYYPCQAHTFMGYRINLQSGITTEDISGLKAGKYSVLVTDANGCTTTALYTVTELPNQISLTANITGTSCGQADGAIDVSVTGGQAPYTFAWDTTNTSGTSFAVTEGTKSASHPYFGLGNLTAFLINGEEAKELNLVRGINYSFNVFATNHPFHFSTDPIGGNSSGLITAGQSNAPNANGIVSYTPAQSTASHIYYDCANHTYMGYNVNLSSGYLTEDLTDLHNGMYSVVVTDANGCSASASYTVSQTPGVITLDINSQQNVTCFNGTDGAVDFEPANGVAPYTLRGTGPTFAVTAVVKNHSHPYYGLGSRPDGFAINGIQGAELTLIRGITYTFSVLAPTHAFFISTSNVGGPLNVASEVTDGVTGSITAIGTLTFTPNANHPSLLYYQCGVHDYMGFKLNIVDQLPDADLNNCMAGDYSLSAVDANGCIGFVNNFTITSGPAIPYYFDVDGDGYGISTEQAIGGCTGPAGFAGLNGDCDDANPAINPGAIEVCDGIDNNCNGSFDDNDNTLVATIYYPDADHDNFGDASASGVAACSQPLGMVTNHTDCNDSDAHINPGTAEDCNGIDDNCNGLIDEGPLCNFTISVQLFIQGFYLGGNQQRAVVDPTGSPNVCDTITVMLLDPQAPYSAIYSKTAVLSTTGTADVEFPKDGENLNYIVAVRHRNSIEIWSADPLTIQSGSNVDFISSSSAVYSGNVVELEPNIYGMYSGDVNQDGFVNEADLLSIESGAVSFSFGYVVQDLTGDGEVESADYSLVENNYSIGAQLLHP
jgi:hypothetical protein